MLQISCDKCLKQILWTWLRKENLCNGSHIRTVEKYHVKWTNLLYHVKILTTNTVKKKKYHICKTIKLNSFKYTLI